MVKLGNDGNAIAQTGAESILLGLKRNGVSYLFANAGTDFPPVIEALCRLNPEDVPIPVTVPHETASVGMAHGNYLVTGEPQAVMVHVNVGLANAAMGVINAASDNIPVVVMSGRTPLTEIGRRGSRVSQIQYGQEMYDQTSLVRDVVKFNYEMRYPEQGEPLVSRAIAIAKSEPRGPVYLSLPREPLMAQVANAMADIGSIPATPTKSQPDATAIDELADMIAASRSPVVLCQRGDTGGLLGAALVAFCERHAIAIAEPFSVRNVMPSDHPMYLGNDPKAAIDGADLIIVLDSGVPWIESLHRPPANTKIVHISHDPHFQRMPIRGYQCDLAIVSDPTAAVVALDDAVAAKKLDTKNRLDATTQKTATRRKKVETLAEAGSGSPMSAEWMSLCLSNAIDEDAVIFNELGVSLGSMILAGPNRVFTAPHSGGLGWGVTAALGAQLADRNRLTVACVGDGSYIFANPVACHQIAEALELPILTIIKNNGMWNAVRRSVVGSYPEGSAVQQNTMPLTSLEPAPDYLQIAAASRAHTERVENGSDLPAALSRAIEVIRTERRQAVLELRISISDSN